MEHKTIVVERMPQQGLLHIWADNAHENVITNVDGVASVMPLKKNLFSVEIDARYNVDEVIAAIEQAVNFAEDAEHGR